MNELVRYLRGEVSRMKKIKVPRLLKAEKYQAKGDGHCHQVKSECSPHQAKA